MSKAAKQSIFILIFLLAMSLVFAGINVMEKQDVQKKNVVLEEQVRRTKENLTQKEGEMRKLEREIENQIAKARAEKQDLTREIDRFEDKIKDLENETEDIQEDRDTWKRRVEEVREERDELMSSIKSHKKEVSKLEEEIDGLKEEKKELVVKLKEKPEPQIIYKEKEPEIVYVEKEAQSNEPQMVREERAAPVINITSKSGQNEEYWAGILREKMELEMQVEKLQKTISDNEIKMVDLNRVNENLKVEMEMLQKDKESIEREIVKKEQELEKHLVERAKEHNEKERMISSLSIELAKSKNENSLVEQQSIDFEKENKRLRQEIRRLVSAKGSMEKSILKLAQDKQEVEKQMSAKDDMMQSKIDEIWAIKESIDSVFQATKNQDMVVSSNQVELPPIVVSSQESSLDSASNASSASVKAKNLKGSIVSVNQPNNFVIINLGEDSGIEIGDMFNVFKDSKYLGQVEVIQVRKDIAAADIKEQSEKFNVGDIVK